MPTHTTLKGPDHYGDPGLSDNLEGSLYSFLTWGLLGKGAFTNVTIPTSGVYGGDRHRLRLADDPNYEKGQVWEGFRGDWVWETGVEYGSQPLRVSGVYVNGGFQPLSATGGYAHHIDYPLGRVVFDSAIPATSVVTCEYSFRSVHTATADAPWWRQLQTSSLRNDSSEFLQYGSGSYSILGQSRVPLPAVVVRCTPHSQRFGLSIGGGQEVKQEVFFYILSETHWDLKQLHDILTNQHDKRIIGIDKKRLFEESKFPLNADGSPVGGATMYPDLVKPSGEGGCPWQQIRFDEMVGVPAEGAPPGLFTGVVRGVFGVDVP